MKVLACAGAVDGTVHEIDVYGPGPRAALVKASSGDVITETPGELRQRYHRLPAAVSQHHRLATITLS